MLTRKGQSQATVKYISGVRYPRYFALQVPRGGDSWLVRAENLTPDQFGEIFKNGGNFQTALFSFCLAHSLVLVFSHTLLKLESANSAHPSS